MPDVVSREVRSRMMSGIRGKNTRPELKVRRYLHARGFRYLLHDRRLPGQPDIVLPRYRTVVFVHGCFWHRHPGCQYAYTPRTRVEFWRSKLQANRARDLRVTSELRDLGWEVVTIWECALRSSGSSDATLATLVASLQSRP